MCERCREYFRLYGARRAEKLKLAALGTSGAGIEPLGEANGKRKAENEPDVLQRMKKRFKQSHAAVSPAPARKDIEHRPRVLEVKHDNTEYQTATEMYKAMKALSTSTKLQFRGSFSIVAKADTDNITRARLVVRELRKIARIPFEHDKPMNPVSGESYRVSFKCTCLAPSVPKPFATNPIPEVTSTVMTANGLKRKQSDLTLWAGVKPKHVDLSNGTNCSGKVVIVAEDDTSHFLGILGQKLHDAFAPIHQNDLTRKNGLTSAHGDECGTTNDLRASLARLVSGHPKPQEPVVLRRRFEARFRGLWADEGRAGQVETKLARKRKTWATRESNLSYSIAGDYQWIRRLALFFNLVGRLEHCRSSAIWRPLTNVAQTPASHFLKFLQLAHASSNPTSSAEATACVKPSSLSFERAVYPGPLPTGAQ
ncbi:hypothetical protein LshimejAT787_1205120 [Lyophyllum shimeji]|uniref:Uncharacterized protein n=1 Tax=Lyophyllum shimeji TaxID=47721 RepID=A0A9P3PW24_LYOSH|nr:hypothetical protein LshimejAT787_1205120 [Lyophyllum shimeji]